MLAFHCAVKVLAAVAPRTRPVALQPAYAAGPGLLGTRHRHGQHGSEGRAVLPTTRLPNGDPKQHAPSPATHQSRSWVGCILICYWRNQSGCGLCDHDMGRTSSAQTHTHLSYRALFCRFSSLEAFGLDSGSFKNFNLGRGTGVGVWRSQQKSRQC